MSHPPPPPPPPPSSSRVRRPQPAQRPLPPLPPSPQPPAVSVDAPALVVRDWIPFERAVAAGTALVVGFRFRLPPDIPLGYLLGAALLPVTIGAWQRYRGARAITVVAVLAALSGIFLTAEAATRGGTDLSVAIIQTSRVLGLALGMLALLWTRSVLGSRLTVLLFGVGTFLTLALTGVNYDNPWKFSFSVPVTLILLGLPWVYGRKRIEFAVLLGVGTVSVLSDSRSAAAMMLIAAGIVLTRRSSTEPHVAGSVAPVVVRFLVICIGGFYLLQAAALEGALGDGAQTRTVEQIDQSGSLLLGGRPELGASVALLTERPLGYGAGAVPTPSEVVTAKNGMAALGYEPNNDYVEEYLFGTGFEVHSLVGDLWILFGPAGALLAVLVAGWVVYGMVRGVARGAASGVLIYLALRTAWDLFFSPFPSVMLTVMIALALALPEVEARSSGQRVRPLP